MTLRRLEALEEKERIRERKERGAMQTALIPIWQIVLAYYLSDDLGDSDVLGPFGDLEAEPYEAEARALNYASAEDHFAVVLKFVIKQDRNAGSELVERYYDAYRRLFAKVSLDFDQTPSSVLFESFVKMVHELPERCSNWLKLNQKDCDVEIAPGSCLPRGLSRHNFLWFQ